KTVSVGRTNSEPAENATHPPAPSSSPELPALPGYEILELLFAGGMGVIYRARQLSLNRLVAVKMIRILDRITPEQLKRFRIEAIAISQLNHPHVVRIYDFGGHNGLPYFSMELVDGQSLAHKLASGCLPADQAARLVETLAAAMHYVHQTGIIHRDLKPANVL